MSEQRAMGRETGPSQTSAVGPKQPFENLLSEALLPLSWARIT